MNFEDIEIPTEFETEIFVHLNLSTEGIWEDGLGKVTTDTYNRTGWGDGNFKLLATKKVKIKIPKTTIDFRGEVVTCLEAQKEKELAEHHMKMKVFQDKIDNLLAIEYKPGEAA